MPNPYQQQMMPWNMGFQNPYAMGQAPDTMLLNQLSQGFAPVMTMPQQQMRTGFEQLPGFNNPGLMGMAMNMFVAPMLQQQMSKFGMVPGGMSSQNIMDFTKATQFQTQQQEMLSRIAQDTTQEGVVSFARGMAEMTGRPFDAPQRQAARQIGSMVATAAPVLAQMMPEQMDALAGRRGSAVVMAQRMSNTNRYRMDPVTGLMGFDPESTEQQARTLFDEMYTDENMSRMRGVRAGEVGGLYTALAQRGMLGADQRSMPLRTAEAASNVMAGGGAARQRVLDVLGPDAPRTAGGGINFSALDPDQLDKLTNQTDVSTQLRAFDSTKVKRSLEGYVDVVSTMKEIFGEAGRTDAPMGELIQSLEALSQGGLTQVSPGRLNQMVRTTAQLAQTSGMTLDAAIMMQQQAGGQLQARGMNPVMAAQITQGAMGFGQAFTSQGALANPAWGLNDANAQRQLDQTLRVQAANSPLANAMGAMIRAEDSLSGGFREGSEAEAMSTAIREGRGSYTFNGRARNIGTMTPSSITEIMSSGSEGNISQSHARQFVMQTGANEEAIFDHDIGNIVRELQPNQIGRKLFERTARNQASQFLIAHGQDTAAAGNIGGAVSRAVQGMTAEERTDTEVRTRIMRDAIMDASGGAIGARDAEVQANLMWGQMEEQVSGDFADPRYSGYGSLQNLLLQQDRSTIGLGRTQRRLGQIEAGIKNDMSGMTGGSFLGNIVDAVYAAGEGEAGTDMGEVLAQSVGGVRAEEIRERLEPSVLEHAETRKRLDSLKRQWKNTPDGPERQNILNQLNEERRKLKAQSNNIRNLAESSGILEQEGTLDIGDIDAQENAAQVVRANRADTMRHMFGSKRSDAEELRRGAPLMQEALGENAADTGAITQIAQARGDKDITPEGLAELERSVAEGGIGGLSETERLSLLKARQDQVDTRVTEGELDDYMSGFGISKDVNRAPFQEILSTKKRMLKTGTTDADLGNVEVTDQELNRFMAKSGVSLTDIPEEHREAVKNDMRKTLRETKGAENVSLAALSEEGSAAELNVRWKQLEESGVADTLRRAEKENRERTNELLEASILDPRFLQRTGGRGEVAIRGLQSAMQAKDRLGVYFGGDIGRQGQGHVDTESAAGRDRLRNLVLSQSEALFDDKGQLTEEYAGLPGFEGMSRDDFLKNTPEAMRNAVRLGSAMVRTQDLAADEAIQEQAQFLRNSLGREGRQFLLDPTEEVTSFLGGKGGEEAKRLQAFRNIQVGMSGSIGELGLDQLNKIASEDWSGMSEGDRKKKIKDLAATHGVDESEVRSLVNLGEATYGMGKADKESLSAMDRIRDSRRDIGRLAENFGMDKDELVKDLSEMKEGGAEAYVNEKYATISEEDQTSMRMGMSRFGTRGLRDAEGNKIPPERMAEYKQMAEAEAKKRGMTMSEFESSLRGGLFTEGSDGRKHLTTRLEEGRKAVDGMDKEKKTISKNMGIKESEVDDKIRQADELEAHNKERQAELAELANLDKGGAVRRMASELGLDPDTDAKAISDLQRSHGVYAQSAAGRSWANVITDKTAALTTIGEKAGLTREETANKVRTARKEKLTSSEFAKQLNISETEASRLMEAGGGLADAGMLSALAEGKTGKDLKEHLSTQLASLEKQKVSAEDSRQRIMEIRGKVKLEGDFLHLDQTEGHPGR